MKVVGARRRGTAWAIITFERDGVRVEKTIRIGDRVHPEGGVPYTQAEESRQTVTEIAWKAREADRDIAFQLHGDAWRDHVAWKHDFWAFLTTEQLAALIPDSPAPTRPARSPGP